MYIQNIFNQINNLFKGLTNQSFKINFPVEDWNLLNRNEKEFLIGEFFIGSFSSEDPIIPGLTWNWTNKHWSVNVDDIGVKITPVFRLARNQLEAKLVTFSLKFVGKQLPTTEAELIKNISEFPDMFFTTGGEVQDWAIRQYRLDRGVTAAQGYACGCVEYIPLRMAPVRGAEITLRKQGVVRIVTVLTKTSDICPKCAATYAAKESMRPDASIQNAVFTHGVDTGFTASWCLKQGIERSLAAVSDMAASRARNEICGAWNNEYVGNVGIFIKGEATAAFTSDCCSFINALGDRIPGANSVEYFTSADEMAAHHCHYHEFFVRPRVITGVWAKADAPEEAKAEILAFAKKNGLKLTIVD